MRSCANSLRWHPALRATGGVRANSLHCAALKPALPFIRLPPRCVFGRDNVTAYKEAFARQNPQAKMGHEEFVPQGTTDFTAPFQRIADSLKGTSGRKVQVIPWGGEHPIRKLAGMNPERFGIEVSPGGSLLSVMQTWREFEGLEGGTYYHYGRAVPRRRDGFGDGPIRRPAPREWTEFSP